MQHLIDNCRSLGLRVYTAPVDYTKSTAFQLSFMDNYKLKDEILKGWKAGARKKSNVDCLLLDKWSVENYRLSEFNNARLNYVKLSQWIVLYIFLFWLPSPFLGFSFGLG